MKVASLQSPLELLSAILGVNSGRTARNEAPAAPGSVGQQPHDAAEARFDLHRATPTQLRDFITQLHRAGVLPPEEFGELSQLVQALQQSGLADDRPRDLLKYVQRRVQQQRQEVTLAAGDPNAERAASEVLQQWQRWLDALRKLDALARHGAAQGIDATV